MKTAKQIFDSRYEYYRNMENKPAIPLEARQMIFDAMEEYASQSQSVLPSEEEIEKDVCDYKYHNEGYSVLREMR